MLGGRSTSEIKTGSEPTRNLQFWKRQMKKSVFSLQEVGAMNRYQKVIQEHRVGPLKSRGSQGMSTWIRGSYRGVQW